MEKITRSESPGWLKEKWQERARITIEFYKLNKNGKSGSRKKVLEIYRQLQDPDIDEFPYRFYLKANSSPPKSDFKSRRFKT